jgi:Rrf2 family protein
MFININTLRAEVKLSTKSRYGLRALIEIAKNYNISPVKRKEISANQKISDSYLENILILLKTSRIIETTRGINGGYVLCRKPSEITVFEILSVLEGPMDLVECVFTPEVCEKSATCSTRIVWSEMAHLWQQHFSQRTLLDLLESEKSKNALDYAI